MNILFICTGNSCRSVMACYYLKKRFKDIDKKVYDVDSAGTSAVDGMKASSKAVEILKSEGIDARGHFSKNLNKEIVEKAELIYVMSKTHLDDVLSRFPDAKKKTGGRTTS